MTPTTSTIIPFIYGEQPFRTCSLDGTLVFGGPDVCQILGLENTFKALSTLEDDEKITVTNSNSNPRAGIPHQFTWITEPGLYRLIFKSRKKEALDFQRFFFHEVLPAIRRSGSYSPGQIAFVGFVRELIGLGCAPDAALRAALRQSPVVSQGRGPVLVAEPESPLGEDAVFLASMMEPGRDYGTADLFGIIPAESRLGRALAGLSASGRHSKLGKLISYCAKRGLVERDRGSRLGKYSLPQAGEKIVEMAF